MHTLYRSIVFVQRKQQVIDNMVLAGILYDAFELICGLTGFGCKPKYLVSHTTLFIASIMSM